MKVIIIRTVEKNDGKLDVSDVTLLSAEEYEASRDIIPKLKGGWWWLRSPGYFSYFATIVFNFGRVSTDVCFVNYSDGVVRPALSILNLKSLDLRPGDQIIDFAGHDWTVISDTMVLCNDGIGKHCFREDWEAPDANSYEASAVKKYLQAWAAEKGLITAFK